MRDLQERLLLAEIQTLDPEAEHGGWHHISWRIPLTEDLIWRARDFIDWKAVVMFQPVSTEFLKEHRDRLVFPDITECIDISNKDVQFWDEFGDELMVNIGTCWIVRAAVWLDNLPARLMSRFRQRRMYA